MLRDASQLQADQLVGPVTPPRPIQGFAAVALFVFLVQGSVAFGGTLGPVATSSVAIVVATALLYIRPVRRGRYGTARTIVWPVFVLLFFYFQIHSLIGDVDFDSTPLQLLVYGGAAATACELGRRDFRRLCRLLAAACLTHCFVGLFETVSGQTLFYGTWKIAEAQYVGGFLRAASTTADPNYLALTIITLTPFVHIATRARTAVHFAALSTCVAALLCTFSRSALISVVAVLIVGLFAKRTRRATSILLTIVFFSSLLAYAVAPQVGATIGQRAVSLVGGESGDASAVSRADTQAFTLALANQTPVFGRGYGVVPIELSQFASMRVPMDALGRPAFAPQTAVLNTYLTVYLQGGLIGLIMIVILAAAVLRLARPSPVLLLAWLATLLMALTLDVLQFPPLWALSGAIIAAQSAVESPSKRGANAHVVAK